VNRDCKIALAKAQGMMFDEDTSRMYNFTTSLMWQDERISRQMKDRFADFEDEGGDLNDCEWVGWREVLFWNNMCHITPTRIAGKYFEGRFERLR